MTQAQHIKIDRFDNLKVGGTEGNKLIFENPDRKYAERIYQSINLRVKAKHSKT